MTLKYGSIVQLFVDKNNYRKNPADQTIGINAGIVNPMNADYDGVPAVAKHRHQQV